MRVIILEDVKNIGKKYEVKDIKDGYARNFLLPRGLVKPATEESLKWLEMQKEIAAKKAEGELKETQELASKVEGVEVPITVKIGEKDQLFEKITAQKIAEKLKEMGYEVAKNQIVLADPITELGEFPIKIKFDHNLEAEVTIIVTEQK